jgi:hypothetical protein
LKFEIRFTKFKFVKPKGVLHYEEEHTFEVTPELWNVFLYLVRKVEGVIL